MKTVHSCDMAAHHMALVRVRTTRRRHIPEGSVRYWRVLEWLYKWWADLQELCSVTSTQRLDAVAVCGRTGTEAAEAHVPCVHWREPSPVHGLSLRFCSF
jgi:hypothetical protein